MTDLKVRPYLIMAGILTLVAGATLVAAYDEQKFEQNLKADDQAFMEVFHARQALKMDRLGSPDQGRDAARLIATAEAYANNRTMQGAMYAVLEDTCQNVPNGDGKQLLIKSIY